MVPASCVQGPYKWVCGGGFHHVKEILMKISKCSFHALGSFIKHITQKKKRFHDQEMIFFLLLHVNRRG